MILCKTLLVSIYICCFGINMVDSHSIVNTNSLVHSLSNNKNVGFMNRGV